MDWGNEIKRIEDFIKDQAPNGVVIGISGGLDSAVVYELCVRALEKDDVLGISLDYIQPGQSYLLPHGDVVPINDAVNEIYNPFRATRDKTVLGNIKARVRMVYLYAFANAYNLRVVGTTNKSEWLTGYFTKFGDGGCDFEPLLHLYKTQVRELAKVLGIPKEIIDQAPSADLWEGQTDEGELGISYEDLDIALESALTTEFSCGVLVPQIPNLELVAKATQLMQNSAHKRNPPPHLKGVD